MTDHQSPSKPDKSTQPTEGIKEEDIILITETSTANFSHTIYSIDASGADPSLIYSYASPPQTLVWRYHFSELPPFLKLPPEDIHVVISTKSGAEKALDFYETVLEPLLSAVGLDEKKEYNVLKTESHESITRFVESRLEGRAAKGIQQTVMLLAGDGGVVDLVNGLLRVMGPRLRYGLIVVSLICWIPPGLVKKMPYNGQDYARVYSKFKFCNREGPQIIFLFFASQFSFSLFLSFHQCAHYPKTDNHTAPMSAQP
jgi:hypothetical protein